MKLGDVCDSVSVTFDKTKQQVVLINTSDVLEGEVTNHILVDNKGLKGQFK
ncbi:restriction endonuclease subunit S, partial [Streptococcus agalactiae]|nr:restriction endonuclease subunit S [Streptococcus agalactiae]